MTDHDRELLKNRLRILAHDAGIRLDTPEHWVIGGVKEPRRFFEHVSLLMEPQSILYIEGTTIKAEVGRFYRKHESLHPVAVACDTAFPTPDVFHLIFSPELIRGMNDLISRKPIKELFNHIKGYHSARVVFEFHDAFDDVLCISDSVGEPAVAALCRGIGVPYSREHTQRQATRSLLAALEALEHGKDLENRGMSWWRHIVNEFKAGFREE